MTIKYIGHSMFHITTADGVRVVTDPYEPGAFGGAIGYGACTDPADVVTVSHEHADHNYVKGVEGTPVVLRGAGTVKDVRFEVVQAHHDTSGGKERGEDRLFKFVADGITLAHLGDLGHVLTSRQVAELKPVDVLLIPVGGTFTVDAQTAWEVVRLVGPKIVIPMHFKTGRTALPLARLDDFLRLAGDTPVERVEGSSVELTAANVGESLRVIALQPAN